MDDPTPNISATNEPERAESTQSSSKMFRRLSISARGGIVAGCGVLILMATILIAPVLCLGNPAGCGNAAMIGFQTAQLGLYVAIVGVAIAIAGLFLKRK